MATSLRSCERKTGFVVGKNYRLQDIQLSKIIRGKYRPSELTAARALSPDPLRSLTRGATKPRSVRSRVSLESLGALPLDQASDPMDLARSSQAGPFKTFDPGAPRRQNASTSTRVFCEAGQRAPAERKRRRRLPAKLGGEYRARTGDLLVANQALSQLS